MDDCCAICLEHELAGAVALACGHRFHAACVLAHFAGEPVQGWRCPCCRTAVITAGGRTHLASSLPTLECGHSGHMRRYTADKSMAAGSLWASLQSFLQASQGAVEEVECLEASKLRPGSSKIHGSHSVSMALLERVFPPAAGTILAYAADWRVRRILDPSAPSPAWKVARVGVALVLSVLLAAVAMYTLRGFMQAAGTLVCAAAEGLLHVVGRAQGEQCMPMVPDHSWVLPLTFAFLGAYISAQIAWLFGASFRRTMLRFDECALTSVALWWAVTVAYTFVVYAARFVLTVVVGLAPAACTMQQSGCGQQ